MSCCLPDGVNCEDKIPSKVNFERSCQNRIAGAVFVAAVVIQYVLAILTLTNVEDPLDCFGGTNVDFSNVNFSDGFGAAMKKHIGSFIMAIVLALLLGFVWIYSLQRCSLAVVWGTLITEMVLVLAAAIAAFAVPGGGLVGLGVTILVFDALALLIVFLKKKAVDNAAFMLQSAAYCVQYNCSMVIVALVILLGVVAYSVIPIAGLAASFLAGHWSPLNDCVPSASTVCICEFSQPSWINGARVFNNLVLVWVFFFSNMMRTYMVGATAALWYWHPESTGRPFTAFKWAWSVGFGTLSLGGLVVTIIDRINRWASSKLTACCCLCCNPLYLIMFIVMMVYKEIVNSLAKFCIIVAALTGEDFYVCVGRSFYTLRGKFATLFVVDGVSKLVMYSAAGVFSCVLWAFAWFVAAGISGEDTLGYQHAMWSESANGDFYILYRVLLVALWILAALLVYYPLIGLIVCVLWGSVVFGTTMGTSFLIGVFAGALANYLFTFFADVVLDVTTAMFTIVRIDHKNGIKIQGDLSAGSPASVGMYYFKLSGDADTGTELTVTPATAQAQSSIQVAVTVQHPVAMAQPVMMQPVMTAQPVMMAQPYGTQPMMAQPYGTQPMMAQPYGTQPMMAQPMYGQVTMAQPIYSQATMSQPAYGGQPAPVGYNAPYSDPYDASKPIPG